MSRNGVGAARRPHPPRGQRRRPPRRLPVAGATCRRSRRSRTSLASSAPTTSLRRAAPGRPTRAADIFQSTDAGTRRNEERGQAQARRDLATLRWLVDRHRPVAKLVGVSPCRRPMKRTRRRRPVSRWSGNPSFSGRPQTARCCGYPPARKRSGPQCVTAVVVQRKWLISSPALTPWEASNAHRGGEPGACDPRGHVL